MELLTVVQPNQCSRNINCILMVPNYNHHRNHGRQVLWFLRMLQGKQAAQANGLRSIMGLHWYSLVASWNQLMELKFLWWLWFKHSPSPSKSTTTRSIVRMYSLQGASFHLGQCIILTPLLFPAWPRTLIVSYFLRRNHLSRKRLGRY